MASASRLDICNQALVDELSASPIQSLDEATIGARECRRLFPQIVAEMLDGPHDWSFANRRVALAEIAVNDRPLEWAHAYQIPSDCGSPIRVLPGDLTPEALLILGEEGLFDPDYFDGQFFDIGTPDTVMETRSRAARLARNFIVENEVIYTDLPKAILEYTINEVEDSVLTALVRKAVIKDMASRLAVPIKKDRKLKSELVLEAEVAWARAIADDLNRQPTYMGHESEAMRARARG
jgi:hypothetical protein